MTGPASEESARTQPVGRRSRKLQRTRSSLTRSALDLFAEHGFHSVTVTDIANRSDVDPSTFFRHFRSKESVLFTDLDNYVRRIRPLLELRQIDEPLIDTLRGVTLELLASSPNDPELEYLRAELTESSADLRALASVHREQVAIDLAQLIAERFDLDAQTDARPYLAATTWVSAFDWYGRRNVSRHQRRVVGVGEAMDEVVSMVTSTGPFLLRSARPHGLLFGDLD